MKKLIGLCVVVAGLAGLSPVSRAGQILVGQCVEYSTCWTSGASWSDSLSGTQLADLGLGSNVPFTVAQTSGYVIRLGATTMTFTTGSGTVTQSLPEFSGSYHGDPCNLCEIDIVGSFSIPSNALSAMIDGTFGNSAVNSSAGANLCLGTGPGPCAVQQSVPEPSTLLLFGAAVAGLPWLVRRQRKDTRAV